MKNEKKHKFYFTILFSLFFLTLLISSASILISLQVKHELNDKPSVSYLSEPIRYDKAWGSLDM